MYGFGFIDEDRFFRGGGELGRARSDPAMRARIDELKPREREGIRRWLAELENYYRELDEADPVTPERVMSSERDAAFGRDLILKVIRLAQRGLDSGETLTWWSKEIRDLKRLHERVTLELGRDTRRGLKVSDGARKGHRQRYGDTDEKRRIYQAKVDELARAHPTLSRNRINALAADCLKVSAKTIQRHTTNPLKK